ncbi:MAG: putative TNF receptor-associated factor 4-like [Harvfovirus sp.]|uniref:Putative TNF receptor-associated factor 4-like n=1 Tax=Harvfovirus sp. TaxID=2487768 RepID=A0A3G5A5G5_9VIRU|nr:MAG: putative TNF receptor-associated factor 4-like [Harvfovirus sp.]
MAGGFEFDSTRDDLKEFICGICHLLSRGPSITNCMHLFCASCINQNQRITKTNTCPNCRGQITYLVENNQIKNFIERQITKCQFVNCEWKGTVEAFLKHELLHPPEPLEEIIADIIPNDDNDFDAIYFSFAIMVCTLIIGCLPK